MSSEEKIGKLSDESWRILGELIETGQAKLKSGKVIIPSNAALLRTLHELAKLKPPKQRKVAQVDDFRVAKTTKGDE